MKVDQSLLKTFIFLNTIIFIISLSIVYYRIYERTHTKSSLKEEIKENKQVVDLDIKQDTSSISTNELIVETLQTKIRRPKFVYFSTKAQKVSLIGSFNEWIPQPMQKVDSNKWELVVEIPEGRYLYNFLVDGKIILDPNNKKPPEISEKGFKSSVLELK